MRRIFLCLAVAPIAVALQFASCRPQVNIIPPKEPIKIEIKVELHIYQHAVQDIGYITGEQPVEEIESEAPTEEEIEEETPSPAESEENKAGSVFLRFLGVGVAYAETSSDQQQLKRVLDSMRKRYPKVVRYKADKSIGENRRAYVEARPSPKMSNAKYAKAVRAIIAAENADRRLLYQIRARMDRMTPAKEAAAYARRWREIAKPGEWIEVYVNKRWVWKQK